MGKKRNENRPKSYFDFQRFQASYLLEFFKVNNIFLKDKQILDCGCLYGGYSFEFARHGGNVVSVDMRFEEHKYLLKLKKNAKNLLISQITADALCLPFKNNSFDIIIASSLIEHVFSRDKLLHEFQRCLSPNGILYLSFPPLYSFVGGHTIRPFNILPSSLSKLISRRARRILRDGPPWLSKPCTIAEILSLVKALGFEIIVIEPRYLPFSSFVKIPVFRELLVQMCQLLLRKSN
ncbi:MAG: class I SAM-dependent methyltransferase [Promethearchaeota archaeon]